MLSEPQPAEVTITPDGWKKTPTIKELKTDFETSREDHDLQVGKIKGWLDTMHVRGAAKPKKVTGRSQVQPKLVRKQAEWRYPSLSEPLLATDDLFSIEPRTFEDAPAAHQNSLVLNYQFNTKIKKQKFVDKYVRRAVDHGTAIVHVGWEYEEEEYERTNAPIVEFTPDGSLAQLHIELEQMRMSNPALYQTTVPEELRLAHERSIQDGVPYRPTVTGYQTRTEIRVLKNQPTLEICDYRNITVDPTCGDDIENAQFIIKSFETNLSKLRKEGSKYKNLDKILLTDNSPLADPDHETESSETFQFHDDPRKVLVAYEYWGYWDFDGSGVAKPIVATWVGNTLIRLEESPLPIGNVLPFVFVPLLPVENSVYGEPDAELLEDNQKIIGAVTRGMIDIMAKSANGQMGYRKDALDAVNRRRFQRGEDYEYNGQVNPDHAFYTHQFPEIPVSAQFMLQQQNWEAESMTGVKAFSTGINSDALGEVARGISGALDAAGKRETAILRRLADGLIEVGRMIIAMNQEFLEDEEIIRITNEGFMAIRRDDLAGHFDMRMDISTAEEDNIKAQELAFMLQTMGNNMDPGIAKIILRDIARLRRMPELAKQIENYDPQPDPMTVAERQLDLAIKEMELANMMAEIDETYSKSLLNRAKARREAAEADLTDLNFVEQESGVTQEREKELHGEQARSNMALEVVKQGFEQENRRYEALEQFLGNRQAA